MDYRRTAAAVRSRSSERGFQRVRAFALSQSPSRVAAVLAGVIAVLAVLGAGERLGLPLGLFDFDGEGKPLAAWSALVLATGGLLAALIGTEDNLPGERRWLVLAGFLVFMGLDEGAALHEHVETDLDFSWQIAYAPLLLLGGAAWCLVLQRLWPIHAARWLWIGGAVLWFLSQVDEQLQSNPEEGRVHGYGALSGIEEVMEVSGSALFLLALLIAFQTFANSGDRR